VSIATAFRLEAVITYPELMTVTPAASSHQALILFAVPKARALLLSRHENKDRGGDEARGEEEGEGYDGGTARSRRSCGLSLS
jgi:hypothetical protein